MSCLKAVYRMEIRPLREFADSRRGFWETEVALFSAEKSLNYSSSWIKKKRKIVPESHTVS